MVAFHADAKRRSRSERECAMPPMTLSLTRQCSSRISPTTPPATALCSRTAPTRPLLFHPLFPYPPSPAVNYLAITLARISADSTLLSSTLPISSRPSKTISICSLVNTKNSKIRCRIRVPLALHAIATASRLRSTLSIKTCRPFTTR